MELNQIGKYKVLGKIGHGAMGDVYKAHDPFLHRDVAIKMISATLSTDPQFRERFQREAQSAARLNHPNIITVYDFDQGPAGIYMAMELLDGNDLKDVIAQRALTRLEDKLSIVEQICDGLAFAHANGVIHRDLKPGNIHLLRRGDVKILDFGLVRLENSEMTATGMVMGTPNYMSPEQVRGQKVDARSDVFSLGSVFYEILTYHKAFDAHSMHSILFQVLEADPEPVRKWAPEVPPPVIEVVEKALAKEPEQRFQDAGEMREALRKMRAALDVEALERTMLDAGEGAEATIVDATPATILEPRPRVAPAPDRRSLVTGAAALDLKSVTAESARTARPARTIASPPTRPQARRARSRAPLYASGAAVAVLAVAGAAYWKLHQARPAPTLAPAEVAQEQMGILTEALVTSQLELARADLENKDYKGALEQVERALKLDPSSAAAKEIREKAQGLVRQADASAAEARKALEQGDTERAARALSSVLAIDPQHPVAGELSAALNHHFRNQAEEARRASREAKAAADRAKAGPFEGFGEAVKLVTQGEAALKSQEFTVAAQKFLESRDGFERARRAAEAAARVPPPRPAAPSAPPSVMVAAPTAPPFVAAAPSLAPVTLPPAVPSHGPATAGAPAPPTAAAPGPEAVIRSVIADFKRAIESKDLNLYRTVKPNLSPNEEKQLREFFKAIKSLQVGINIQAVQIEGGTATVRVIRQDAMEGQTLKPVQQTFRLVLAAGTWTIQSIGQ